MSCIMAWVQAIWRAWGRLPTWALALLVAAVVAVAATGAALLADFDGDGLSTWAERPAGTSPTNPDSDGDGLSDGAERVAGTNPLRRDTDEDGLWDGADVARGGDPLSGDTDGDGIPDAEERDEDCDGDGIPAIASSDDDADLMPDRLEPPQAWCVADADGDGLLDGDERNGLCILRSDCDDDGLSDLEEHRVGYDPLDPDTFSTGLPDAVALAFEAAGQAPTPDADGDGIPDGWEQAGGLIDWGTFSPRAGERDLMVEYLRVVGPDSGRYSWLDFKPAYRDVTDMFAAQGVRVQWKETLVVLDVESRPDFLTPDDLPYYQDVLDKGTASTNPYVTSVILNPQQVQTHGSILGAAFLRNMVATVDYGAHTEIHFESDDGQATRIRPIVESQLLGGLSFQGYDDGGVRSDGSLFLHRPAQPPNQAGFTVSWFPNWFRTAPLYEADGSSATLQLRHAGATLHTRELAATIAHELGHTLSLCHPHEPDCAASYGGLTTAQIRSSTMSYAASPTTLSFLAVEWDALKEHLRCPPQATAALVAQGADDDAILAAKYDAAFSQQVRQRACMAFEALPQEFEPTPDRTLWDAPALPTETGQDGTQALRLYVMAAIVASLGGAAMVVLARRR